MDSAKESLSNEKPDGCYIKARYVLAVMIALGVMNVMLLRNGITVAILKMVKVSTSPNSTAVAKKNYTSECPAEDGNFSRHQNSMGEFDWTVTQQTWLLGCYYYGYMLMNIPAGLLAKRYGMRNVFGIAVFLSAVLTLLIPACARLNFGLLIATRAMIGFMHGTLYPSVMTAWEVWSPPAERSRMLSITFGASSLANCFVLSLAGVIAISFGWEAVFYFTGGAGLLWSISWFVLIHDSPATHPRISANERKYIEESIGTKQNVEKRKVPWSKIFTSLPVLGTTVAHFADNWAALTLIALGPMYLQRVLKFDIKLVGLLSSLPQALRFIITLCWGFVADFIIAAKLIPRLWLRKFSTIVPAFGTGLSLIAVAYLGCNKWPIVFLLSASIGILGMTASGHFATFLDIAPTHAGVIFSLSNTLNSAIGFLGPQLSGLLLVDNSLNGWKHVFWLAAVISFIGGIAYGLVASDQVQNWARDPISTEETETTPLISDENDHCDGNINGS